MLITVANLTGGRAQSTCAVNLASELAGITYPCSDRWQSRYSVVLFDADPFSGVVGHYCSGENLPVSCEHRRLADKDVEMWIRRVLAIALEVDYVVMVNPPHYEALTKALVVASDLIVVPCSATAQDLAVTAAMVELIHAARPARADAGPKCMLVPMRSAAGSMDGNGPALQKFGEPLGPVIEENPAFENAYRERRWIGDFAWNSPAHESVRALAVSVKELLAVPARLNP